MTLSGLGQTNDDNAFFTNSYDKKVVSSNNIDTICIVINFSGKKTERFYAFDKFGNLTYSITFDQTGTKTSESILKYNSQGQLIYRKDNDQMINNHTDYFYNANRDLAKAVTKEKDNEIITVMYSYDKQKLVEETRKERTGKLVTKYKYDKQNRLIDLTTLTLHGSDTKGTIAIHKTFSYDNNSNKSLEEVTFFTKDTIVYRYDEKNRLTLVQKGNDTEKYFYNDNGLLIRKDIVKFFIDTPMSYAEKYRYVVRQ